MDAAGNFVRKVGDLFDITLPSGLKLNIAKDSAEDQLYTQLSGDFTVNTEDKTQGWLNLNGVFFNSGSAELTAESSKQVKNIAAILKEYPAANIKVGGYTDNTGDAAGNKTLSAQRAEAVAKLLVAEGVPAASVASEGYGSEHPECPANDTDICKAQNRRVALRLTAK
ncbi:MAG: hypothetical protein C4K58_02215 [Flavobacteriaceae bacterium]|nr:MAG: hypothetical protein C4K58_02215 [Flavobacteriaceae bacterium]